MRQFQEDESVPFFVLSLKAGGAGLNLTAASHVIHFDRWWNPAVEDQATDRAFRIGQTKNVLVHKFLCRGTVEEKIDQLTKASEAGIAAAQKSASHTQSEASLLLLLAGLIAVILLVAIAIRWGLNPNDLKLVTALFVFAALVLPGAMAVLRKRMTQLSGSPRPLGERGQG